MPHRVFILLFLLFSLCERGHIVCSEIWKVLRSIACPWRILVCTNSYGEVHMHASVCIPPSQPKKGKNIGQVQRCHAWIPTIHTSAWKWAWASLGPVRLNWFQLEFCTGSETVQVRFGLRNRVWISFRGGVFGLIIDLACTFEVWTQIFFLFPIYNRLKLFWGSAESLYSWPQEFWINWVKVFGSIRPIQV